MRLSRLVGFIIVALMLSAPVMAQDTYTAGSKKEFYRNGSGGTSGTLDDVWVEMKKALVRITLETDTASASGATRIALHQCNERASGFPTGSCQPLNIIDSDLDGLPDTNVLTGTPPQRGIEWISVPGWIRIEVTTQPSGTERPIIVVSAADF